MRGYARAFASRYSLQKNKEVKYEYCVIHNRLSQLSHLGEKT